MITMKNKERINEKFICECGCVIMKRCLKRHERTPKHINLMNKISKESN